MVPQALLLQPRVFIDRAGRPEEDWDSRQTLHDWAEANGEGVEKLHAVLLGSIAWIEFFPDTPERQAAPSGQDWGAMRWLGKRSDMMQTAPEFTRVATRLGLTTWRPLTPAVKLSDQRRHACGPAAPVGPSGPWPDVLALSSLPAAFAPLGQMRALRAEGGVAPMARVDPGRVGQPAEDL